MDSLPVILTQISQSSKSLVSIFQMLTFANSDSAAVGQSVIAIGSPLGLENSVSNGIVSGLRDESGRKWIQTTAPASPGNSGGPLINLSGQVLGVLAWKVLGGENLNFAIPSNSVKSLLAFAGSSVKPLDLAELATSSLRQGNPCT
jgi:S1-C subfamily serine protease